MAEENKKQTIVKIGDSKVLADGGANGNRKDSNSRPRKNYVEIYDVTDGQEKLIEKQNLVVYTGREWLAGRMFDIENLALGGVLNTEAVYWFGLGEDGSSPNASNVDLGTEIDITTDALKGGDQNISTLEYRKVLFDTIEYEQDSLNDDRYLIIKITVIIPTDDANGYDIAEAALLTNVSDSPGIAGAADPWHLFARVAFDSIQKDSNRELKFIWYIYV